MRDKEYILEIKKLIPEQYCKKIISYFDNDFKDAGTIQGVDKEVRNCFTRPIEYDKKKTFGQKIVYNYIKQQLDSCNETYSSNIRPTKSSRVSQLDLLKYPANEYKTGYEFHCDFGTFTQERAFSISICLNNDFTGGEFVFDLKDEGKIQYPQNTGDAIMFPSHFGFPHKVNQITSGTRYALIGWII